MEYKRVVGEVETNSQYQCIAGQIRCVVQTIEFGVLKRIKQRVKAVKINRGQCADIVRTFSSGVSGSFEFVKEVLDLLDNPETYQSASEVNRDSANIPESSTSQKIDKASRWRIQELCLYSLAELDRCLEMGEVYLSQCSDVQFWRTALRMSIIAPNTSEASHTELSYIFREFAWSVDVIRLAFTAFKVLFTAGLDLLQQDVALEWCARSCRLVLNMIGDYNILQENHSVLQSSSVKDSDEKELLRMLKEVAVNKLWLLCAYQKQRSKIASFLRQKMEGPGARTDYLPTTFEIDHRDITLKEFGDNGCASVGKCEWQGEMVAVKYLKGCNPEARKIILDKEVTLLASVQHPNIVQLLGFAYDEKKNLGMIVMELMQMNLRDLIVHKNKTRNRIEEGTVPTFHDDSTPFPLDVAIHILLQIAEGMCHLRGLRVMHRDLKAVNILVNQCNHRRLVPSGTRCNLRSERESFYHVKLADFGVSKSQSLASKFRTRAGTTCWLAPEVLEVENKSGHKSSEYTWSADVYSFGITCSEVLTGLLPFQKISKADLLNEIRTGERPPLPLDCPESLRKIINDCWATNAKSRPDFVEIREKLWRFRLEMLLNDGKLSMSQNLQDKLRAVSSSSESQGPGDGLGHAFLASLRRKILCFNLRETADRSPSQQTEEDIRKAAKGDLAIVHTHSELQEATRDFHPSIQNKGGDKEGQYEGVVNLPHRDFVVGLEPLVERVMDMLKLKELTEVQLNLGVVGMGGLGKTTLVEDVFRRIRTAYNAHYFLSDVRERSSRGPNGIVELQRELLWGLSKYEGVVKNVNEGKKIIRERLTSMKVFVVLDDVDNEDHLDAFLINKKIFGHGSKVIVTSRNGDVLRRHDDSMHWFDMEGLGMDQAMKLFSLRAFKKKSPKQEFQEIVKEVVVACDGLPLSLEVMGAYLGSEPASQWPRVLKKLKNAEALDGGDSKDSKLWKSLKISFDQLGMREKALFLDIVCFFNKNENVRRSTTSHIWGSKIELQHLIDRSIVKISKEGDLLVVHDQLRDLGRKIVEEESPHFPGKRSRLWDVEVANEAFATKKLSENVRGLALEGPWESIPSWAKGTTSEGDYDDHCTAPVREMPLLKYLTLTNVSNETFEWILDCHPCSLSWLFVKETWPGTWESGWYSAGEVWKRKRCLQVIPSSIAQLSNLKVLRLEGCKELKEVPEFIGRLTMLQDLEMIHLPLIERLPASIGSLSKLTSLDLSGCQGLAAVPESVGQLTNLTSLDLSGCGGLAAVLESVGQLTNLTSLDLSGCGGLAAVPESVGQLTNLTSLDLCGCGGLAAVPESVGQLTNLTSLDLCGCGGLAAVPESIGQLINLTSLDLSGCGGLAAVPESVGQLTNLTSLDLSRCGGLAAVPESVGQLTKLTSLDLSGCGGLTAVPESIGQLINLTSLDLSGCGGLAAVPESVGQLTNLTSLDLSGCGGLAAVPESVGQLTNLTSLDLSGCLGLAAVPEFVGQLINLTSLDLSRCWGLAAVPESVGQLTDLTSLDLSGCRGLTAVPESVGQLTNLTSLDLSRCRGLTAVPESVGKLPHLTSLSLSGCRGLTAVPESVGKLPHLTSLSLSGCRGLTVVPESVGQLTNLTSLDLSRCRGLTAVPESVGKLPHLTSLSLSRCGGLAAVPESVGQLTNLTSLSLSGCGGLAAVPESVGQLTNLTSLDLSGCWGLTAVPESVGQLTNLTSLNLSGCGGLTAVPESVGQLTNLTSLDLSGCGDLATVPESVGQLSNLTNLSFSGCGGLAAVPESVGQLANLTSLNLRGCWGLAAVPESVGQLANLTSLNLRGCWGLAAVPESVGQLTNLTSLNLIGCEDLTVVPESVGQLANLTSLSFFGCGDLAAVPESVGQLANLTSLSLSWCGGLTVVPESVGQLANLTSLSFFECGSLSAVPESVGQLSNLTSLDLSRCRRLAIVPESVGQLTNLTSLYLSGCGGLAALPEFVGQLTNLTSLDLSGCWGLIAMPESVGKLINLTSLDLSRCWGLAAVPESVGQLTNLTSLNLSGCGSLTAVPESVGQLSNLTSLDLSGCGGLAAVPESVGQLTNLTSLYLSGCGGLLAVPQSVGQLTNLTSLNLSGCGGLAAVPESVGQLTSFNSGLVWAQWS